VLERKLPLPLRERAGVRRTLIEIIHLIPPPPPPSRGRGGIGVSF